MTFRAPKPGELNHLAAVEHFTRTGTDANGQPVGTWDQVSDAYVKRETISGRVAEIARQLYEEATHNIYCRYNPKVNRGARFVIDGVTYAIGWVDADGGVYMRCTCSESWPEGQP